MRKGFIKLDWQPMENYLGLQQIIICSHTFLTSQVPKGTEQKWIYKGRLSGKRVGEEMDLEDLAAKWMEILERKYFKNVLFLSLYIKILHYGLSCEVFHSWNDQWLSFSLATQKTSVSTTWTSGAVPFHLLSQVTSQPTCVGV